LCHIALNVIKNEKIPDFSMAFIAKNIRFIKTQIIRIPPSPPKEKDENI